MPSRRQAWSRHQKQATAIIAPGIARPSRAARQREGDTIFGVDGSHNLALFNSGSGNAALALVRLMKKEPGWIKPFAELTFHIHFPGGPPLDLPDFDFDSLCRAT